MEFVKNGYDVVINYNGSEAAAMQLKELVEDKYGVEAMAIKADVSNEDDRKPKTPEIVSSESNQNSDPTNPAQGL